MLKFRNANEAYEYMHDRIIQDGVDFAGTKALFNVGFYITDPMDNKIINRERNWKQDCDSIRKDMMDTIQTNVFEDMEKVLAKLSPYEQVLFLIIKNGRSGLIQFDDYTTEDVTNQGLIYLRKYFYEKEGIYDDEIIPWSEGRIPRNKNLRVKFEANRLNTNQTV